MTVFFQWAVLMQKKKKEKEKVLLNHFHNQITPK